MNFKQYYIQLNEVFDVPYFWKKVMSGELFSRYEFTTDSNIKYSVDISHTKLEYVYEVVFEAYINGHWTDELTETGDAFSVFATVLEIMESFRQENLVKEYNFTATESSRKKLYEYMLNHFSKKIGFNYTKQRYGHSTKTMEYIIQFEDETVYETFNQPYE